MLRRVVRLGSYAVALATMACASRSLETIGGEAGSDSEGAGTTAASGASDAGAGGETIGEGGRAGSGTAGGSAGEASAGGRGGNETGAGGSAAGAGAEGGEAGSELTAGASGAGGAAGSGGMGGGAPIVCSIHAEHEISGAIGTVGIVRWSTTLSQISSARIEFGPDTNYGMQAPVDLTEPDYRTLLLGMKPLREYHYRIVASTTTGGECTSGDYTLTTNALPNGLPSIRVTGTGTGFLHSCFFGLAGGGPRGAFILDPDGDYVWYGGTGEMGRALIHPDNRHMYYASVSPQGTGGTMRRIRLDGTHEEDLGDAFSGIHHDFTILSDGTIAFIRRVGTSDWVAEWKDGTSRNLFNVSAMFGQGTPHVNSIHYHPSDDSYTFSDRNYNAFVKATRAGVKLWKLGGSNGSFTGDVAWNVNHGHQMIGATGILFFNNGNTGRSRAVELSLDLNTMRATEVWAYAPNLVSSVLGDVQILDNGHRVITFSTSGVIDEVRPEDRSIVQSIEFAAGGAIGYSRKRLSLYWPVPRR